LFAFPYPASQPVSLKWHFCPTNLFYLLCDRDDISLQKNRGWGHSHVKDVQSRKPVLYMWEFVSYPNCPMIYPQNIIFIFDGGFKSWSRLSVRQYENSERRDSV
jgi:hypothetical protein